MNIRNIFIPAIMLVSSFTANANAALRDDFPAAHAAFIAVSQDQGGTVDDAWVKFEALEKAYPNHPLVQVYFGALKTVKADKAIMPWSKMMWVEKGLDLIDSGLALLTNSHNTELVSETSVALETRLEAVKIFLAVPDFLNRFQDAKDVFGDLLDTENVDALPSKLRIEIYSIGAKIAERDKNILEVNKWQQKIKVAAASQK
ncbi:MAG: hypothetical protein V4660_16060 [Pseudomonadota bacterium]